MAPESGHRYMRRDSGFWTTMSAILLSVFAGGLGVMTVKQWRDLRQSERVLPISLISRKTADYSAAGSPMEIAPVSLDIIRDMIRDSQPEPSDLSNRLARADELLHVPIPGEPILPGTSRDEENKDKPSGLGEANQGSKPSKPDKPTAPGTPKGPETPDKPAKEDKPDKPGTPDKADKPDKPDKSSGGKDSKKA